jgi:adenylate cyclase
MAFQRLGSYYSVAGQFEESVSAHKQALLRNPDSYLPHMNLAVTYIALGREKEARSEASEVLRLNPKFSVDALAKTWNLKNPSVLNGYIARLSKAGLK